MLRRTMGRNVPGKKLLILAATLAVLLISGFYAISMAQTGTGVPGSADDPVVTRSYVEEFVSQFVNRALSQYPPASGTVWQIKTLAGGETFTPAAGTEIIIRSGRVVIVDPVGSGIPDLTDGTNLLNGRTAPLNHLLLVPRADKRGVKAVNDAIIMYRGGEAS